MGFEKLAGLAALPVPARPTAFVGFDGFVDTVGRLSHGDGHPFDSMGMLGAFLSGRDEKNCALEVSRSVRKMGGNAPISANALAMMGIPVACVGALGIGTPEPSFSSMDPLCSLWPVAMPGECLALEFSDSKLFLADMSGPKALSWESLVRSVGLQRLSELSGMADLLGFFNWGELPNIQQVWEGFATEVLPGLDGKRRIAVFDLSDCSGRSAESIRSALGVLKEFRRYMPVVLSANDNEVLAIARAVGYCGTGTVGAGEAILRSGNVDLLVHHSLTFAWVFEKGMYTTVNGIHIDHPVLVTGGGDHFNAGLCLGLLAGLDAAQCAALGNTVSRLYVSTGCSPTLDEVMSQLTEQDNKGIEEEGA